MKRFAWIAVAGAALLAACGGVRSPDFVSKLQGIQVTPANSTIDLGGTVKLAVSGIYSAPPGSSSTTTIGDVSDVAFAVDKADTASVDNAGNLRGLKRGTVKVTATAKGFSSSATVNVTGFVLTAITVNPANTVTLAAGFTQAYTTQGTYTDQTGATRTSDVTETVSWSSSATAVATVAPAQGATTTATTLPPGGTSTSITASATNFEGTLISKSVTLNVTAPVLTDLVITPVPASTPLPITIPVGATQTFAVQGIYSDSQTPRAVSTAVNPVTWTSSAPAVASFSQAMSNTQNVLTANTLSPNGAPITLTVSAPDGSGKTITSSKPIDVTISNAVLRSISAIVAVDGTNPLRTGTNTILQLKAQGLYTDGSTQDLADSLVTWSVANGTGQATITTYSATPAVVGGTLKGVAIGSVTVSATASSATTVKTITAPAAITDPICVVPFIDPPATATGVVTGGPCTPACTVTNSGNVVSSSQTDYAAMSISPTLLTSANLRLNAINPAPGFTATTGQQAGFIIAYTAGQFSPGTDLMISVNGQAATSVTETSLTGIDGLARSLVRVPVTGQITSLSAVVVDPAIVGADLLSNVPGLLQTLLGGTTAVEVRYYAACAQAVAPTP